MKDQIQIIIAVIVGLGLCAGFGFLYGRMKATEECTKVIQQLSRQSELPRIQREARQRKNAEGESSSYGGCSKCGDRWNWKASHDTRYSEHMGCFPLCEECWDALTPKERLPYYRQWYFTWHSQYEQGDWQQIKTAVLAGR